MIVWRNQTRAGVRLALPPSSPVTGSEQGTPGDPRSPPPREVGPRLAVQGQRPTVPGWRRPSPWQCHPPASPSFSSSGPSLPLTAPAPRATHLGSLLLGPTVLSVSFQLHLLPPAEKSPLARQTSLGLGLAHRGRRLRFPGAGPPQRSPGVSALGPPSPSLAVPGLPHLPGQDPPTWRGAGPELPQGEGVFPPTSHHVPAEGQQSRILRFFIRDIFKRLLSIFFFPHTTK